MKKLGYLAVCAMLTMGTGAGIAKGTIVTVYYTE
jgi:hypothetical protein